MWISTVKGACSSLRLSRVNEVAQSCPTLCDRMDCSPTRLLRPWDFAGKNAGVGCNLLLREIFSTHRLVLGLLHCWQTLYCLSYREAKEVFGIVIY